MFTFVNLLCWSLMENPNFLALVFCQYFDKKQVLGPKSMGQHLEEHDEREEDETKGGKKKSREGIKK